MSYPILYKANETDFTHLGVGVLSESVTAFVVEERNGIFELEMKYPIDGVLFSELKNDRLIKADASPKLKRQRFKIIRITKPANGFVTVYGEHIAYLAQDLALKPEVSFSGTALSALNTWRMNLVDEHPFTVYSDVQTTGSGKWTIDKVENARRALGGVEGSLLDIYGGEYRFDNYHIGLYSQRGDESEALIAYGKNIMDLTQEEEIASTYTSIYPFAILRDGESEELLTLPEYFVDSEHVSKYARRKIQVVDFSQDEIDTVAKLRTRAERYIKQNSVGVPKVNLKVKFIDLSKTLDYEHLKLVEEINLCDVVTIYFDKLDIHKKAKVIKVTWDVLAERYEEIEIGEARSSLSNTITNTLDGRLEPLQQTINYVQVAANGKNRIFRGLDQPTTGMSLNDLWYKPVGDGETELYRFDGAYWKLEKVSAGLLAGTLDAENGDVNLINLNASSIVTGTLSGLRFTNDFIRGGHVGQLVIEGDIRMQSGPAGFSMDEEVVSFYDANNRTTLSHDGLTFYRDNTEIAAIKLNYFSTTDSSAVTFTNAREGEVGVRITQNRLEATERQEGQANSDIFVVPSGDGKLSVTDKDSVLWWGIKTKDIELQKGAKFTETSNGGLDIYTPGELTLRQGGGPYALSANAARVRIQRELDMGGFAITNQSDIRLKTNIVDSSLNALAEIERLRFIEYDWDKSMTINEGKPSGRTFGIIAQHSPFLQTKVGDSESYLSVDISKQVNLNSKAIQELLARVKTLEGLE